MEINRRKLFGLGAGAAVAAPDAARQVASATMGNVGMGSVAGLNPIPEGSMDHLEYLARQKDAVTRFLGNPGNVAKLKKALVEHHMQIGARIPADIEAMRSLSPIAKERMAAGRLADKVFNRATKQFWDRMARHGLSGKSIQDHLTSESSQVGEALGLHNIDWSTLAQ